MRPLRLHAVGFLNAVPLVWGLTTRRVGDGEAELRLGTPVECGEALRTGAADAALVPVAAIAAAGARPLFEVGLGIAARGRVDSVLVVAKRPCLTLEDLATFPSIATDNTSRTSVALLTTLFHLAGLPRPRLEGCPPDPAAMLERHDAALLIGDPALRLLGRISAGDLAALDLSEEWSRRTGLPFVFALWAMPPGGDAARVGAIARESFELGWSEVDRIASEGAWALGLPEGLTRRYLRERIQYRLGEEERAGLERFLAAAAEARALPA